MDIIDGTKFKTQIKSGLSGGYLFYGEEEYLKRNALLSARKAIVSAEGEAFDLCRLDEENYSPDALETAILSLPVFSEKRFCELHGFDFTKAKASEQKALESVLAELENNEDCVFILYAMPHELEVGTPKKPSKLFNTLCEYLTPVLFEKQSRIKLSKWVTAHFNHNGVEISPQLCEKLLDYCGLDMFVLNSECEKISAYVRGNKRTRLEEADIELLATKNPQFGDFDLANAVMNCDIDKALAILSLKKFTDTSSAEVGLTLGSIATVYKDLYYISVLKESGMDYREIAKRLKIHEYRCSLYYKSLRDKTTADIERMLELCSRADVMLKTGFGARNGYDIIIEAVIGAGVNG